MRNSASLNARRLDFVDALRGVAALYVVSYHLVFIPSTDHGPILGTPHWASAVVENGGTAVTLFFVISAFSLCHTMRNRLMDYNTTADFYIRRLFRIAPLFYVLVLIYFVKDALYYHVFHSAWEIAKNLFFVFNFFPGSEQGLVWASWTIGVEMVFYLLFPLIFQRLNGLASGTALFLGALFLNIIFQEITLHLDITETLRTEFAAIGFVRHLPVFVFGMLSWAVYDRYIAHRSLPWSVGIATTLAGLWGYHALLRGSLNVLFPDAYYWQPIIYSVLLLGLGISPSKFFVNRATLFCGKISYSIYLLHPLVIFFLTSTFRRIYASGLPASVCYPASGILTLSVLLPISWVSYRLIESPGMQVGKWLLERRKQSFITPE